jgi:predicted Zn-dependent protease
VRDRPSGELLDLAQRVTGAARGGEEVEAYVVRSRETEVRVFDGDVESLSMAGVEGVGVRHQRPPAGLRLGGLARTESSTRRWTKPATTPGSAGRRVERPAVTVRLRIGNARRARRVARVAPSPCPGRQGDARARARAAAAPTDPRSAASSTQAGDTAVEAAVASSLGVAATSRRTMCSCSSFAIAGDADETQTGYELLRRPSVRRPRRLRRRQRLGGRAVRGC